MYKVLIVDDEPFILEGLKQVILWDEHGLEISGEAACGEDALDYLQLNKVDILITDIRMPGMSGLDLLHRVKEYGWDIKCIILSGYDDFEYVREAARLGIENYLLKPVSRQELSMTLLNTVNKIESSLYGKVSERESKNILRNNILYRWMTNNITESELFDRAPMLSVDMTHNYYLVSIVKIQQPESTSAKIQDWSLLGFSINNICGQLLHESALGLSFCDLNGEVVVLFHNACQMDMQKVHALFEKCISSIQKNLGCKVVISVGIPVYNYCDVSKSYATAKDLQDYFLIFPSKNIALYNAIQTSTFPPLSKLKANFSKFDDLLLIKDKAALKRFIVNTYDQLKQASVTPQQLQIFTVELVLKFLHSVKSKHRNSVYLFSDLKNSLAEVLSQRNIEEVVKHLSLIVEITVDSILAQEAKTNPLVKNVLNYVNENYAGNISLKILSDRFNLSAAYLGQLFKNETGEMFTNYLNAIRVKNSNELLRNTTLKINEIAEKVGYVNQIYFTRIYKKVTGLTPIEFRKHNQ